MNHFKDGKKEEKKKVVKKEEFVYQPVKAGEKKSEFVHHIHLLIESIQISLVVCLTHINLDTSKQIGIRGGRRKDSSNLNMEEETLRELDSTSQEIHSTFSNLCAKSLE